MTTPLWTAAELEAITKGRWLTARSNVTGLAYLPRRVKPGDLYVALTYEGIDHHINVANAFQRGAAAALITKMPPGVPPTLPLLATADLRVALWQLGKASRDRSQGKFIGVTGRVGKTYTKDTLAKVLSQQASTQATEGNDNDMTGVGITLARLAPTTDYNVLELSLAQYGDVANSVRVKSQVARPHVAIITRVGSLRQGDDLFRQQHLDIADAKAYIFEGLQPGGFGLINRDDEANFTRLLERARALGVTNLWTFGKHPSADIRLVEARRTSAGFNVEISLHGKPLRFAIGVRGRQFVENTLAVIGAVYAIGANLDQALAALAGVHESSGRGNCYTVPLADGNALLIDYTRKVTLASLYAALELLAELQPGPGGRRIAVVSGFEELEVEMATFYADIAATLEELGIDLVFGVGEPFRPVIAQLLAFRRGGLHSRAMKSSPN